MGSTLAKRGVRTTLALVRDEDAPASARRAIELISHALGPARQYAAKLLVSELVTNSVKYGGDGPVRVEIQSSAAGMRVEVVDEGRGFALEPRKRQPEQVGGWGLVLVEALASRWGCFDGSSHIWFEIDAL